MALAARHAHDLFGAVLKRQPDTCVSECSVALNTLQNPSDLTAICTNLFFYSLQICINCLAASGTATPSTIDSIEQSATSIVNSCRALGRPVTGLTTPAIGGPTTRNSGTPTNTVSYTPAPPTSSTNSSTSSDPPLGAIIGGAVGGVALLAGIGLLIFFLMRRRKPAGAPTVSPMYQPPMQENHMGRDPSYNPQGYFPVPRSNPTPPLPMQQQPNQVGPQGPPAGAYAQPNSNRWSSMGPPQPHFGGASSQYSSTQMGPNAYQPQIEYANQPSTQISSNTPPNNRMSVYSSYPSPTSNNSQRPLFSPPSLPPSSPSTDIGRLPSPPSTTSPSPPPRMVVPQQYPITESFSHSMSQPSGSPPPYVVPAGQASTPFNAAAAASGELSEQEIHAISQRVASIMGTGGQQVDPDAVGRIVATQKRKT